VHVGWKTDNGFWRSGGWEMMCVRFRWGLCEDEMGVLKGSRRVSLYINITSFKVYEADKVAVV
jgi:hypothetical protein